MKKLPTLKRVTLTPDIRKDILDLANVGPTSKLAEPLLEAIELAIQHWEQAMQGRTLKSPRSNANALRKFVVRFRDLLEQAEIRAACIENKDPHEAIVISSA